MKTILITGASSGLGKATARLLQNKGWRVIATIWANRPIIFMREAAKSAGMNLQRSWANQ